MARRCRGALFGARRLGEIGAGAADTSTDAIPKPSADNRRRDGKQVRQPPSIRWNGQHECQYGGAEKDQQGAESLFLKQFSVQAIRVALATVLGDNSTHRAVTDGAKLSAKALMRGGQY